MAALLALLQVLQLELCLSCWCEKRGSASEQLDSAFALTCTIQEL